MTVIDKRAIPLTVTFGDLAIGEGYQDEENYVCIKTGARTKIYYEEETGKWEAWDEEENTLVIPLNLIYTIERGETKWQK